MKILVLIDNNLQHDNRVKRHIQAMLEQGHQVKVVAMPFPKAVAGYAAPGMEMSFWEPKHLSLDPNKIRGLCDRLGLTGHVFAAFPAAIAFPESLDEVMSMSRRIQRHQLSQRWWDGFEPICREAASVLDEYQESLHAFELMLQWAEYVCDMEADCVYCNDLLSLPAGVAHKLKNGSRVIFDAHEIYYDMAPGHQTALWKQSMALLERSLVSEVHTIFGVSRSHVEWMRKTYQPKCEVIWVPNCVGLGKEITLPAARPSHGPLRVYYHGASDPWRGLAKIVEAVALTPDTELILRCFPSETLDAALEQASALGIRGRIRVLPLASANELISAIREEAEIGIHAHECPTALNVKVCLANKFIEYMLAGIPIITAPLEEQARLVRENQIGYVLRDNSPAEISQGLVWAMQNRDKFAEMGQRAFEAGSKEFLWPTVRARLLRALMA
ncbi:MAG: hypothetical protein AB7K24_01340 [Gemmataceae bacterium]